MGRRLTREDRPDYETAGYVQYVRSGTLSRTLAQLDEDVIPYLVRYGAQSIKDLDEQTFRRLIKIANGVSKILDAENGK